jgi:hypothetical protein
VVLSRETGAAREPRVECCCGVAKRGVSARALRPEEDHARQLNKGSKVCGAAIVGYEKRGDLKKPEEVNEGIHRSTKV